MKHSLIALLLLLPASTFAVQPQVGDVKDSRTTGQFFAGLEVQLKLLGDDAADIKSARITITEARDDTGRNLIDESKTSSEFTEIGRYNSGAISCNLKNPARKATSISLKGTLEAYTPAKDPKATVRIPMVLSKSGVPIKDPSLAAAGITIVVLTKADSEKAQAEEKKRQEEELAKKGVAGAMGQALQSAFGGMFHLGENSLGMKIVDPQQKLISYRMVKSSGDELRRSSWTTGGEMRQIEFSEEIPNDISLELLISTPQSMQKLPLELTNIVLP